MKELFLLDPEVTFLNHGSYGAVPRPVFDAWQGWQREIEANPVQFLGRRSAQALRGARVRLAGFLGADADDLVFVPNATTGVNVVARSLALQPGEEVLTTDLEYGACVETLRRVCAAQGARLTTVKVPLPLTEPGFVQATVEAFSDRTRLLMLSHITSPTALRLPIERVLAEARRRGIATLVDGAHAPGQIDLDLRALDADFYTGNCHKWMCAPRGTAFLHARADRQAALRAPVTSWGDLAEQPTTPWDGFVGTGLLERRLQWQGTRDLSGCLAVPAAIDFQAEHDWSSVRRRCHAMAMDLLASVARRNGLEPIGPPEFFGQMAPLPVPHQDAAALQSRLFDDFGIEVPVTQHGDRTFVRVSVQAYNDEADLDRLDGALRQLDC